MRRVVVDYNAIDPIVDLPGAYEFIRSSIDDGQRQLEVLFTHVTIDELAATADEERRSRLLLMLVWPRPTARGPTPPDVGHQHRLSHLATELFARLTTTPTALDKPLPEPRPPTTASSDNRFNADLDKFSAWLAASPNRANRTLTSGPTWLPVITRFRFTNA